MSAEGSFLGLAKQTQLGTPNTTDADFTYLLYTQSGGIGPQNVSAPLPAEVGGGALLRDVKKLGVYSGGGFEFIPRPNSIGLFLAGALGDPVSAEEGSTGTYKHTFQLGADQFQAPYFTVRSAPGNLWGEQAPDSRIAGFALEWQSPGFLRATASIQGGTPEKVATTSWGAIDKVDSGAPFITPISSVRISLGDTVKVNSGSFIATSNIPLDEQWIVGSYAPDAQDIVNRSFAVQLICKIADGTLYTKMLYDPAGGAEWAPELFRDGDLEIKFMSDVKVGTTPAQPYLKITASPLRKNVVWTAQPVGTRAGRQLMMAVTGVFTATADPSTNPPITVELLNDRASY